MLHLPETCCDFIEYALHMLLRSGPWSHRLCMFKVVHTIGHVCTAVYGNSWYNEIIDITT